MSVPSRVDASLASTLRDQLGAPLRWERLGSSSSEVWRVSGARGAAAVKWPRKGRAYVQEQRALAVLAPTGCVPRVVAAGAGALVTAWIEGRSVSEWTPDAVGKSARCLARIHGLPFEDDDAVPLERALQLRAERLVQEARQLGIPNATRVAEVAASYAPMRMQRVWCHRDARRQNWLQRGADALLVDFEHSRPDAALVDVAALWFDGALDAPPQRAAFEAAYGAAPWRHALWARVTGIVALGTLCWGTRHEDDAFLERGWNDWNRWQAAH